MVRPPESIISNESLQNYLQVEMGDAVHDPYQVLIDYYEVMDPAIRNSSVAYSPAKSTEMGKVDQTMLNHIRNGVWALIELNVGLITLGSANALSEQELREVIALFSVHDLHKIHGKDWKEQFDISQEEVLGYAKAFRATKFAPDLAGHDFQSVAVALHKSIGFHANLSVKFNLYRPWLTIADTLASIEQPQATPSMQQQLDQIDPSVDFYYHTFQEATGILTNIVHTGIARWASEKGLHPLLIFEKGVLYLGDAEKSFELSKEEDAKEIYRVFRAVLNSSHVTFSDALELQKSIETQGSKGLYSIGNVFFFYSGIEKVAKAFAAAAVLRESENTATVTVDCAENVLRVGNNEPDMQYPPAQRVDIPRKYITGITVDGQAVNAGDVLIHCRSEERKRKKFTLIPESVEIDGRKVSGEVVISGTGLMVSQIGYRAHIMEDFGIDIGWDAEIISYSRAISGLRMQLIDPLSGLGALKSDDPVLETCRMFGVDADLSKRLSEYGKAHRTDDHHRVGGFWNYSYVIARDLLDRDVGGIRFADIQPTSEKIQYLENCITHYLREVPQEKLQELESHLLYPYQEKILVWISENLNFNGSMFYGSLENKTNKFQAYCDGRGICRLTNDAPYDKERISLSTGVGMLGCSFSNRLPVGASEPTMYVSVPIAVEMGLRYIGHGIRGGSNRIYFRLIPDHFYTPIQSRLFSQFLSVFSGDCQTNVRALALDILSWDTPQYELLVRDLISDSGRKNVLRYAGYGYKSLHTTYDIVFNKVRDNNHTEYWFFGAYLGLILAAATGCRVVVGENPICMSPGDEFPEAVRLDAPHAAVKRVFGDAIPLSRLSEVIDLASLIIVLGYEIVMDDKRFPKHLQALKNKMFPGSSLLKTIWRRYENEQRTGAFVNRARGYRRENEEIIYDTNPGLIALVLRLDRIGGDIMAVESIHGLAELGLTVAIPKGYEPHRVEKLFRESVKAILAKRDGSFAREDYIDAVSGRLLKMMRRAGGDQFSLTPGLYEFDRTHQFAGAFVDHIFYGLFDGNPGKLKRAANDISDGYYSATLELRDDAYQRERATIEVKKKEKAETEAKKQEKIDGN